MSIVISIKLEEENSIPKIISNKTYEVSSCMKKDNKRWGRQIRGIYGEREDFFFSMQIATKSDLSPTNETKSMLERSK